MSNKRGTGSYDYVESQDRWRWRGYYTDPITGKRKIKSLYGKSKRELRDKVETWLIKAEGGQIELEITLERWVEIWLQTVIADTVKLRTKETYHHVLTYYVLPVFGKFKLKNITPQAYQEFLNDKNCILAPSTVAKIRRYSIMCVDATVRYGYIATNPLRNTRPPRQYKREIVALSCEETDSIISKAKAGNYQEHPHHDDGAIYLRDCYYTIIVLAVDTGMRQGEILGLQWGDIFSDYLIVRRNLVNTRNQTLLDSPKTLTSERKIVLGQRCINVLNWWRARQREYASKYAGIYINDENMVFTNSFGHYVSVTNFSRRCWRPILKETKLEGTRFHDLRHSHASQLLAAGVPPQIVSQRLGHSDLGVTLRVYAHLLPNMQEGARDQIDKVFGGKAGEDNNE